MTRFLLTAMPFSGHVTPLVSLAAELLRRGHSVRMYTGAAFRERVEASGAQWVAWHRAPDFDEHDLSATFPRLQGRPGPSQVLKNLSDLFISTGPGQVADLEAEWAREPWDVLVSEESSVGPGLFAEKSGCRWATVTILPLGLPSRQGPPNGLGLAPGTGPWGRLRDAMLRASAPLMMRALQPVLDRARRAVGLPASGDRFDEAVYSPELILSTGVAALDFDRTDRPERLHWIGLLDAPSAGQKHQRALPPWWPELEGRTVVHVTQGTQNIDPHELVKPALEALAGLDVLVVATTGRAAQATLPFAVPENARVWGFLPYDLLLPRVAVMITNGGWGGTLGALAQGIPLVVAGGELDKPEVAARVAFSGAGIDLRTGRPKTRAVREAYDRLVSDSAYAAAARRIADQLADAGGVRTAADLLESFAARR